MANALQIVEPTTTIAIRSGVPSLPEWVIPGILDAPVFAMPPVPASAGAQLHTLAAAYAGSLQGSSKHERTTVLGALRSATRPTDETPDESLASFDLLVAHLADVPIDILKAACRAYANHVDPRGSGTRYFPRGAAEIRVFANPMLKQRAARAHRLRLMAEQADHEEAERVRLAEPVEWTPDAIRELGRFAAMGVRSGWFTQAQLDEAMPPAPSVAA